MKKSLSILVAMLVLGLAYPAFAVDMNGRTAIGGARTMLHPGGLSFRYFVGHLGFQGVLSHEYNSPADDDTGSSSRSLVVARAIFNAARAKDVNMYVAGGIGLGVFSLEVPQEGADDISSTEVSLELALGAEYFFTNHFSVSAEVGMPIHLVGEDGGVFIGEAEGTYIHLGRHLNWGAAFSFIF